MHANSYNLLLRHSPDTVVHQAIRDRLYGNDHGNDLYELVKRKVNALTLKDDESGLLPFMMAAGIYGQCNEYNEEGDSLLSLRVSYMLLRMNPSVLQDYIAL